MSTPAEYILSATWTKAESLPSSLCKSEADKCELSGTNLLESFPLVIGFIFQLLEKVDSHYHPCFLPSGPTEGEVESTGSKEEERIKLQMNYYFFFSLLALLPGAPSQSCFLRKAPHQLARASWPMVSVSFPPQAHFTEIESDRQGDLLL